MKLQFLSDTHLEFRGMNFKSIIKPQGDVLCLAGDICACASKQDFAYFVAFLEFICKKFLYVVHVAGNHEYYYAGSEPAGIANTMGAINKKLKLLEKLYPNYIYLNCQSVTLSVKGKPYTFVGATLWAHVDPKNYIDIESRMNDYECIYLVKAGKIVKYTVQEMQKLHRKHLRYIATAVQQCAAGQTPCVLITHHKPVGDAKNKDVLTQAYETDITKYIGPPVKVAIHGHTHIHYSKVINGIKYLSNPKGYVGQRTGFVDDMVVSI